MNMMIDSIAPVWARWGQTGWPGGIDGERHLGPPELSREHPSPVVWCYPHPNTCCFICHWRAGFLLATLPSLPSYSLPKNEQHISTNRLVLGLVLDVGLDGGEVLVGSLNVSRLGDRGGGDGGVLHGSGAVEAKQIE